MGGSVADKRVYSKNVFSPPLKCTKGGKGSERNNCEETKALPMQNPEKMIHNSLVDAFSILSEETSDHKGKNHNCGVPFMASQ